MSKLFAVRVVGASPEPARLAVRSVHPDSGPPMPTATFALMLLYDPILRSGYGEFGEYVHLEASPLAQTIDRDDYFDSRWIQENARAFVARAEVSRGVLQIWPTHPGWIAHLRKGMAWETAAYSNGPGAPSRPRTPAVDQVFVRSDDPKAGFRVGAPKLGGHGLRRALIASHGASRYLADPVLTTQDAMAAAAPGLLGKAVLAVPTRGPAEIGTIVELGSEGVYLYQESRSSRGTQWIGYSGLKSLGRAWLKVAAQAATSEAARAAGIEATAKRAGATAKKTAKSAAAKSEETTAKRATVKTAGAKRTVKKAPAKQTAKRAEVKQTAKKAGAKKTETKASAKRVEVKQTAKRAGARKTGTKAPAKRPRSEPR